MKFKSVITASIFLFCLAACSASLASALPLDNWHVRAPSLTSASLRGIAYGNGLFVAVGYDSTILTSPDGIDWTRRAVPSNIYDAVRFKEVVFGNGIFIAIGDSWDTSGIYRGIVILRSVGGETWTSQFTGQRLESIAFGNGSFVGVGYDKAFNSEDGVLWHENHLPTPLGDVIFSEGQFFGLGQSNEVYTSVDGVTWQYRMAGVYDGVCSKLTGLAYSNHTLVAIGGYCLTCMIGVPCRLAANSTDLVSWNVTEAKPGSNLESLSYGMGSFVAVGLAAIESSSDGLNWKSNLSNADYFLHAVTHNGNTFVAVGENGTILQSDQIPYENVRIGVPTINEWGMFLFSLLAGLGSIYFLKRRIVH